MHIFMSSRAAWLHSEFQANKGCIARLCLKTRKGRVWAWWCIPVNLDQRSCTKRSAVRLLTLRILRCTVRSCFKNLLKGLQNFSNFDEKFPHVLIPLGKRFFPSTMGLITCHKNDKEYCSKAHAVLTSFQYLLSYSEGMKLDWASPPLVP